MKPIFRPRCVNSQIDAATRMAVNQIVAIAFLSCFSPHVTIASTLYWTDTLGVPGHEVRADNIQRAALDGSSPEIIVDGLGNPQGIALDLVHNKVYWTDELTKKIQRANLDGTDVEDLITDVRGPKGIALDIENGMMFWAGHYGDYPTIWRAGLDGSDPQTVFDSFAPRWSTINGIALDLEGRYVYWGDPDSRKIYRHNMDGTGYAEVVLRDTRGTPHWIAVDIRYGTVYWSSTWTDNVIVRGGSQVLVSGINNVEGIALDVGEGWLYWASVSDDKISRISLDGAIEEDVITGLGNPEGIALDPRPIPEPSTLALAAFGLLGLLSFRGRTS